MCDTHVCGACAYEYTVYMVSMCVECVPAVCTAAVPILCVCGAYACVVCVACEHERTVALSLSLAYAPSPGLIAQHF